jgi:hypothetical protein
MCWIQRKTQKIALAASFVLGLAMAQDPPDKAMVTAVEYFDAYDENFPLLGYVSIPESDTPLPAVVILVSCYIIEVVDRTDSVLSCVALAMFVGYRQKDPKLNSQGA